MNKSFSASTFLSSKCCIPEAICHSIFKSSRSLNSHLRFIYLFSCLDLNNLWRLPRGINSVTTRMFPKRSENMHLINFTLEGRIDRRKKKNQKGRRKGWVADKRANGQTSGQTGRQTGRDWTITLVMDKLNDWQTDKQTDRTYGLIWRDNWQFDLPPWVHAPTKLTMLGCRQACFKICISPSRSALLVSLVLSTPRIETIQI